MKHWSLWELKVVTLVLNLSLNQHDVLVTECTLANETLKISEKDDKTYSSISEDLPNFILILQISLTIVITTAFQKTSFSALKAIKTYLRSTTTEDKWNHIAIFSSKTLDYSHIIESFIAEIIRAVQSCNPCSEV